MLVGEGAERFAVAVGFPRENLLTERSRKDLAALEGISLDRRLVGTREWPTRNGSRRQRCRRNLNFGKSAFTASKKHAAKLGH